MTWNYRSGDKYNVETLLGYKKFFLQDWKYAFLDLVKAEKLRKYGLPNYRIGIIRREMAVEESVVNIDTVNKALREHGVEVK